VHDDRNYGTSSLVKKYLPRLHLSLVAAALPLIFLGALWSHKSLETFVGYRVVQVQAADIQPLLSATGYIEPHARYYIKPPMVGRAERVLVKVGDQVQKGQTLMMLGSEERAAVIDAAGLVGTSEQKKWQQEFKTSALQSPVSGYVLQRNIEDMQTYTEDDNLFIIGDRLLFEVQVLETDLPRVHVGQMATVTPVANPELSFKARVSAIPLDGYDDSNVTLYTIRLEPSELLPPIARVGMSIEVSIRLDARQGVLSLPLAAVQRSGTHALVHVPGAVDREIEERAVTVGVEDEERIEILEGLNPAENVLVSLHPERGDSGQNLAGDEDFDLKDPATNQAEDSAVKHVDPSQLADGQKTKSSSLLHKHQTHVAPTAPRPAGA
jgi:multidrug efflux pump subunit AcrA (membrane-fusion protein)